MLGDRVTTGRFAFACITSLTPLAMVAGVLTPVVLATTALGDVQNVSPYYAVVTADKAPAHSGSNDRFYRVGELSSGQIVLVDGEGDSWSRISYPSTLTAFVRVEDVKVDGGNLILTSASKLKAANAAGGYGGSWKALMDSPLPVGTTLKSIEPAKDGGVVVGYKIAAPDSARAFVESHALRHATDTEVAAFRAKGPVPAMPATTTTPTPSGTGINPVTPGGPDTKQTGAITPGGVTPVVIKPSDAKAEFKQPPAKPEDRVIGTYEQLEDTFQAVWKQPVLSAEFGELKAEYERAIKASKDHPEITKALESRVKAIDLRMDFREKLRKQEEARADLNSKKSELTEEIASWEKTRVYTVVGELQPSTVYDGKSLPQMYRVVSVGGSSARTLGYLKASKEVDLDKMLGQVIGVIGESTMDRSLMLNIIDPVKVVTLKEASATKEATPTKDSPTATVEEKTDDTAKKGGG